MELFRQRLLESTTRQSDLVEIFSAIDRGESDARSPARPHFLLDEDHSGHINYSEFRSTLTALHVELKNEADARALFEQFDTTNNGEIDLKEFLRQLRPGMSERRQRATDALFNSVDMNKDGKLTIHDLKVQLSRCRRSQGGPIVSGEIRRVDESEQQEEIRSNDGPSERTSQSAGRSHLLLLLGAGQFLEQVRHTRSRGRHHRSRRIRRLLLDAQRYRQRRCLFRARSSHALSDPSLENKTPKMI